MKTKNQDMKTKKRPSLIIVVSFCVLVIAMAVIFPYIIAASPPNREIETIRTDDIFPTEESDSEPVLSDESSLETMYELEEEPVVEVVINANAISEEEAIAIAWEGFRYPGEFAEVISPSGEWRVDRTVFVSAKYVEDNDPAGDPSWFLLFSYHFRGVAFSYIPEGSTADEHLERERSLDIFDLARFSTGTDNFGVPVVKWEYGASQYEMVELNAITGQRLGSGVNRQVHFEEELDEFHFEDSKDDIRLSMNSWWTIEKLESGEIIRTPLHHEESDDFGG